MLNEIFSVNCWANVFLNCALHTLSENLKVSFKLHKRENSTILINTKNILNIVSDAFKNCLKVEGKSGHSVNQFYIVRTVILKRLCSLTEVCKNEKLTVHCPLFTFLVTLSRLDCDLPNNSRNAKLFFQQCSVVLYLSGAETQKTPFISLHAPPRPFIFMAAYFSNKRRALESFFH